MDVTRDIPQPTPAEQHANESVKSIEELERSGATERLQQAVDLLKKEDPAMQKMIDDRLKRANANEPLFINEVTLDKNGILTFNPISPELQKAIDTTKAHSSAAAAVGDVHSSIPTVKDGKEVEKPASKPDAPAEQHLVGKHGETVRVADGKYYVTGKDGKERAYVEADSREQTPGPSTRPPFDGGILDNRSDDPVLVLGKGLEVNGSHGEPHIRVLPAHTKTDGSNTDYDGVLTDPNVQPVEVKIPGKGNSVTLMPEAVDWDSPWIKVPDRNTGVITIDAGKINVTVNKPVLWPKGEHGGETFRIRDYTGKNKPITPETHAERKSAQDQRDADAPGVDTVGGP